jgi:hypothetical protein
VLLLEALHCTWKCLGATTKDYLVLTWIAIMMARTIPLAYTTVLWPPFWQWSVTW